MPLSVIARRRQGCVEIDRLHHEFVTWHADIQLPQYTTQLDALSGEITTCTIRLRSALENVSALSSGAAYGQCSRLERQIAWLWRAWEYFRAKFDQRQDDRYADTLHATDEVVWSCYRPFFRQPLGELVPDPAPLPYIEMEYSPVAVRSDQTAVLGERPNRQELLELAFKKLPMPILKLPISAVSNPWVIALAGHEIGHFVQPMISPNPFDFVGAFRRVIEQAAADSEWGKWSVEIFADWYSILTMGQWALHPIAQFGTGEMAANTLRGGVYPSLLVRLELMAALADDYGFPGTAALESLAVDRPAPGGSPQYDKDRKAVAAVAQAIVAMDECRTIAKRIGPRPENFVRGGLADQWALHIRNGSPEPVSQKPDSARLVAAGSVQAWDQAVFAAAQLPSTSQFDQLGSRARRAMQAARMPGVRSSSARPASKPGDVLFEFLEGV
ncbi:hypothetical protein HDF16_005679 [Granulicella aggregans]|uniref:Uncharacterized protein n=1 Tax=Granulicella aggregans TaxID=474949 RepID=A0A7W7ZJM4_9BACT|nr:hypothetical protein [Granulicella aggregans]MBB5060943.1 hypothetical protein [Granulicella aggregans]